MLGDVTSYSSATGALVVNVTDFVGTGSFTAWTISQSSPGGVSGVSLQSQTYTAFAATGTANVYAITSALLGTLTAKTRFRVDFPATTLSFSPATLNINSSGAHDIKQYNASGSKTDPTIAGQLCDIEFDGTDFVILNPIGD